LARWRSGKGLLTLILWRYISVMPFLPQVVRAKSLLQKHRVQVYVIQLWTLKKRVGESENDWQ